MEKQRRDQMKDLYSKLASLLRLQSYERIPLPGLLEKATDSIKQWKETVDRLTARKKELENELRGAMSQEINLHVVQVSEMDSNLEVNLIIRTSNKKIELRRVLSIIEQGGAEIINYSLSCVGQNTHYTIHAQALYSRFGIDSSLIEYNLKQLVS
ncbi:Myc-type, basic helix-loop-helix (bHLH) domain-containing protein [Artemisia annua]|uniref:Myc-type, basic helix-loop-helix (BHLH) domain-containing protein n=1 Tax=Artemisia annua TaxID=35608 RepID=A0A2U1NN30_ARTAN|nr:Myc-type, basic helix-loop-helix (bHLH) domain-containing protein [Artemisia annua]